jgi:predicted nucleic acid-binding protein
VSVLFFDTSAIVRRYSNETGSAWVINLVEPIVGNTIFLARITEVETVSAIMRRTREGALSAPDATAGITAFRFDLINHYRVVEITPQLTNRAVSLLQAHVLRGYDAVQLAAVLEVNLDRLALGLSPVLFICADSSLNAAAVAEGLAVDDPNAHP